MVTPSAQPCQALPEFVLELLCPRAATAAGAAAVERRSREGKRSGPAPATSPRPRLCFAGERAQATEGIVRGLILNSDLGAVTCLSAYLAVFILKILNCTTKPFLYNHKDIFFVKQNSSDL